VTQPGSAVTNYVYQGNEVVVVDPAAKQRQSRTDALGRMTRVIEDPTGVAYETTYEYDALDNLKTVVQGSQTRSFDYDSLSRLETAKNPETGGVVNPVGYQYDANGNLTQKNNLADDVTSETYPSGRIVTTAYY